ncbi:transporter, major facilitator family [Treponema primitia ZAS-2]|uniref:Transporter, major facilitator family n=1 Tax=Treponema primitia (strain ATCC BAA-887 / DSM 12427 / ZAS-2) TaxID=545694 RepID=F5YIA5_TREPZ|nr:MFS transporter [Treponema primitia]AEF86808.1 transporter, major facilitator family [Treponema primitia ZAS-2]
MSDSTNWKKSIPWVFFAAETSLVLGGMIAMSYLIFYITDRMLITAVVMGAIMLVARIADGVLGIFTGIIIQKLQLKHGQYRTWLLYGPFIIALGTTLCFFNPNIPMMAKAVIVFIGYILYGGGNSFVQLSQNGLLAKISGPDMDHRMAIAAKLMQGQQAGTIIGSLITMPLILWVDKTGADGYSVIQVIIAALGALGQLPLFFMTKEYEGFDPNFKSAGGASIKLGAIFGETLKNGQLIILLLADAFRHTAYILVMALGVYYFNYVVRAPEMIVFAMTAQSIGAFLGSFAGQPISRKLGKKNSALLTGILCTIIYAGIAFLGDRGPLVYIICTAAGLFSLGIVNACGVNLYLDCGEYLLYKSGKDNRTFTMSFFGIGIKIGMALSSVVIAFLLDASGYDGATQSVADVHLMGVLIGAVLAGLNLGYFLIMLCYGINEQKSKEYAEHNFKATQTA